MLFSSGLDSGRREDDDDTDRHRFERLLQEKMDMPTSDNGLYLARTVAPVLTKALAEVGTILRSSFCLIQTTVCLRCFCDGQPTQ